MRVRLPLGRRLFFACAFLLALLALLPLRLAADWLDVDRTGVAAREVAGSVWGGVVRGAQYRETQLGDLLARLRALPLLIGRARIDVGRDTGDATPGTTGLQPDALQGALTVSRSGYAMDDATARIPLGLALAPLPVTGIDLSDVSARFVAGACETASGAVTVQTSGNVAGLPLPATMTGNARCDGAALLLPLAGPSGLEQLDLRFTGGNRYRATLSVRPTDPLLGQRLTLAGFAVAGGVYSLSLDGSLR